MVKGNYLYIAVRHGPLNAHENVFFFHYLHFHNCYPLRVKCETNDSVQMGSRDSKTYRKIRACALMYICMIFWDIDLALV